MIGTITLNPCIDKTLVIQDFCYGGMNRVIRKREDASGKGINVSAVLRALNIPVYTMGLVYERGESEFLRLLQGIGVEYHAIRVGGTLRENIKIKDEKTNITTEFNQKGDHVSAEKLAEFEELLEKRMNELEILVINGSVPQGVKKDYYKKIIRKAKQKGVKVILDAEGELLIKGMEAKPFLIKPNLYEFQNAFGLKDGQDIKEMIKICRDIVSAGIEVVCLSLGKDGALIVDKKREFRYYPEKADVKSTQGAGDSMVAGICAALKEGKDIDDMLRYGAAAALGSLSREGTLLCTSEDFMRLKNFVSVQLL